MASDSKTKIGFATASLINSLTDKEKDTSTSIVTPIVTTSTFTISPYTDLATTKDYLYGRIGNPTRKSLESTIGKLENAQCDSIVFSSGMAAINGVIQALVKKDESVVAVKEMYGGTFNLFDNDLKNFGIDVIYAKSFDVKSVEKALTEKTKLVWLETCTNPLLSILDVKKASKAIKKFNKDIIFCVDNTFLSPYILRPLDLGADVVMHSCTKFLGGHSDIIMGCVTTNNVDIDSKIRRIQCYLGASPSSFDCYLLQRSLCTLEVRMKKHHESSLQVAQALEKHPLVEKIYHPLLESHSFHKLAKSQNKGIHSGMISILVKGGKKETLRFLENLKIIAKAVSLGGVHSLACYPATTTHSFFSEQEKIDEGILPNLVRISLGLETVEDLISDIDQALKKSQ